MSQAFSNFTSAAGRGFYSLARIVGASIGGLFLLCMIYFVNQPQEKKNAEVLKVNQCLSDYRDKDAAAINYWNYHSHSDSTAAERKTALQECIRIAGTIQPFAPSGVNPELSAAIRRVKDAHVAFYEAVLVDVDRVFTESGAEPYRKMLNSAREDVDEEVNRLQAKFAKS